jgi:hypothetical protein
MSMSVGTPKTKPMAGVTFLQRRYFGTYANLHTSHAKKHVDKRSEMPYGCGVTLAKVKPKHRNNGDYPMSIIKIPVTKGEGALDVDTDQIPQAVFEYIVALGMKTLINRGTTKVTKALMPDDVKRKAEANVIAAKQLEAIYAGKVRMTGGVKAKAATGEINTEAMRLAKIMVKDTIKEQGHKVSHYAGSEITKAAKELLAADPSILEQATANIEARKAAKPKVAIDVSKIAVSATKVAAANKKAAKDKAEREAAKAAGVPVPAKAKTAGRPVPGKKPAAKPQPTA